MNHFATTLDDGFSDMANDDIDGEWPVFSEGQTAKTPAAFVEPCPKCGGSGRYRGMSSYGRDCFLCKGTGQRSFKQPAAVRTANREKAAARKEKSADQNLADFEAANPAIATWWTGSTFEFAVSLREAVRKYGSLTERQMAAVVSCVEKFNAKKAEREAAAASANKTAVEVNIAGIEVAFAKGQSNGIKKPKLRLLGANGEKFILSLAPAHGRNAGALYVTCNDEYLGKIATGKFYRSGACSTDTEKAVSAACQSPETAAIAYGQRFGECSCCGRELTNALSIELGIGPICRENFF